MFPIRYRFAAFFEEFSSLKNKMEVGEERPPTSPYRCRTRIVWTTQSGPSLSAAVTLPTSPDSREFNGQLFCSGLRLSETCAGESVR